MPASRPPVGKSKLHVPGLGSVEGLQFSGGVRQFSGIKYATLPKRWTRSKLNTSWPGDYHDGTKLGYSAPNPPEYNVSAKNMLLPVDLTSHYGLAPENEANCLVLNITTPEVKKDVKLPVMVYIHGGAFAYGGANRPVFDGVNFVTHALTRNTPVIQIGINYRVGIGGFLASKAIKADLEKDNYAGVGNFGLLDQQVALEWVHHYISAFGGDPNQVTIYGESAGGISVSCHIAAKHPAPFKRAVAMSGHLNTLPPWSLERHEKQYRALLGYLEIDPDSEDSLEQLRALPEATVAAATLPLAGVFVANGSLCDDGEFFTESPSFDTLGSPPSWLEAYMVGDVLHEGCFFSASFAEETFESVHFRMAVDLGVEASDTVLALFHITPDLPAKEFNDRLQHLAADVYFKAHNWISAHRSMVPQTYGYHFDQLSTYDHFLKGRAYHALELLYLFLNFNDELTPDQQKLARTMAGHFIDFAYGKDPWPRISERAEWMRYGPDDTVTLITETEDEPVRQYSRMQKMIDMGIYQSLLGVVDAVAQKRDRMGTFKWKPPAINPTTVGPGADLTK